VNQVNPKLWAIVAVCLTTGLGACSNEGDSAVAISVIGAKPRLIDPARSSNDEPSAVLTGALLQGLVSFDAGGQVEPALAERWITTDDGLSYIFRIRRTRWSDGKPVTAGDVARSLKASLAAGARNPLRASFSNVTEIVAMTDQVLEVRLAMAQPNLLPLLAQPAMAVSKQGRGTGPYAIYRRNPNSFVLRPALPDKATEEQASEDLLKKSERRVRGERASFAIARFAAGDVSLLLGGRFDDVMLVRAARLPAAQFRRDPATGLFGFVMSRTNAKLNIVEVRRALAMVIDREAIQQRFGVSGWRGTAAMLPGPIDSAAPPALPDWVALDRAARLAKARAAIIVAMGGEDRALVLRVALPDGPGGKLLFAQIASDWQQIGVKAMRAGAKGEADLRLIDSVAPHGSAFWYFNQTSCTAGVLCSTDVDQLARDAFLTTDPTARATRIAEVDAAIAKAQTFIPIASPLRWSLVAPRLQGYRESPFAIHPLNRLMRDR
jgi:oligopeptide transport system substrate-binding protein